ncbi:DUF4166 domain-containing protein [Aestuariispira insulae]|uniref:Uncharacterized protein DUF4166 n=1 Tax=Aestuariispira insulae TaxID=1461337 RepID=A0A3D9HPW1_9PROT|nr:DUF4166 domain-containing protein [Aestuariispira insulae]RED51553.1 uncharacterized protein DUF4166 [Aestuariispira insulae]
MHIMQKNRIGFEFAASPSWLPGLVRRWLTGSARHNPVHRRLPRSVPNLSEADNDIVRAMGIADWRRLTPSIRARFLKTCDHASHLLYQGVMTKVQASPLGWMLAQICRLTGTPLAPHRGEKVPVEVAVYPDSEGKGVVWARRYFFEGKKPVTVKSAKALDAHDRLLECVGGGFGMFLRVYEENRALHFRSTRYFWEVFGLRLFLPDLISPGVAHVIHADMGDDYFRFTISIKHRWLGELFFQDGIFKEKKGGL